MCKVVAGILAVTLGFVAAAAGGDSGNAKDTADPTSARSTKQFPNIVLIIIDTLRADKLGCYGCPQDTSPELDGLAKKGVMFRRVIAQCSWTRPSIGSMLTSLYPRTLGLYSERNEILAARFLTLPEILRQHGYRTIGLTANANINRVYGFSQGFDYYLDVDTESLWPHVPGAVEGRRKPPRTARQLYERALGLVACAPSGPRYLQINVMDVHEYFAFGGRMIRPEFRNLYMRVRYPGYWQAVRQVSYDTGRFVRELLALPGWDNTLFVITSDHGEGLADHPHVKGGYLHGRVLYESQILVPLIFYHHGRSDEGRVIDRPVRLLEVMPTILAYIGIPVPEGCEGISLVRHMQGQVDDAQFPTEFFVETYFRDYLLGTWGPEWCYIRAQDRPPAGADKRELQKSGLKADGSRTNKLSKYKSIADELSSKLADWEQRYPRQEPTPHSKGIPEHELEKLRSLGYLK